MIEVHVAGGPVFRFHDDPAELPERRLHRFELALLQAGGMPTSLLDVDTQLETVYRNVNAGLINEAKRAIQNFRFGWAAGIEQGLSADTRALAELLISVDDVPWPDYSEAGLTKAGALIGEHIPMREVREVCLAVKKNLILS